MFSKQHQFPSFEFSEVTSNFTNPFNGFNVFEPNEEEFKDYVYNMLNISEETKNLIDDCLLNGLVKNFTILIKNHGTQCISHNDDKEKQIINIKNKLFLELINNNSFESLNIKYEVLDNRSLIDLIFNLYLVDKSFVLNEQHIIKYLQIKDKIDFDEFYYSHFISIQENFYNGIAEFITNDKYFNIIIDKPALFISIVGYIKYSDADPRHIIRMFDKLRSHGFDDDIFKWSYDIYIINSIDVDDCDYSEDKKLALINDVLKCDKYIKKLNIKNDENLAKWLNL